MRKLQLKLFFENKSEIRVGYCQLRVATGEQRHKNWGEQEESITENGVGVSNAGKSASKKTSRIFR
jgi:hypothetical protein